MTEDGTTLSLRASISSNSSIEGKAWLKSDRLSRLVSGGDDDVDEVGDGGPKLEAGISVCGEGDAMDGEATLGEGIKGEGRFCMDIRWGFGISGVLGSEFETDGVGGIEGVGGTEDVEGIAGVSGTEGSWRSLDIRFDVTLVGATDNPAFWRARIRSAMLPPPDLLTGSSEVSLSGSLRKVRCHRYLFAL